MIATVIKRNGAKVDFDDTIISRAVQLATAAGDRQDPGQVEALTAVIVADLEVQHAGEELDVETIEETIEFILLQQDCRAAAHAYIRHRLEKERVRDARDELGEIVGSILEKKQLENANFSSSPSAKMQQIAATASRIYYTDHLIPREFMLAHEWGDNLQCRRGSK